MDQQAYLPPAWKTMIKIDFDKPFRGSLRLLLLGAFVVCTACSEQPNVATSSSNTATDLRPSTLQGTTNQASSPPKAKVPVSKTPFKQELPVGLPEYYVAPSNPMTQEKVELGRKLFFDKALSVDNSMSCATCHDPEKGWGNGEPIAIGVNGEPGRRNVPTILNAAYYRALFWDGRAGSLERQALGPIFNPDEMGMPSHPALVERLRKHDEYPGLFARAFSSGITVVNVVRAIASYERTIIAGNSPYDRYQAGEKDAMSEAAVRGMNLFMDKRKSKCSICHEPPTFTALFYHNLGVGIENENPDLGRFEVTKIESQTGHFKVPSVRDVKDTGPYMHDGSMKTLEEVVEFYDKGGTPNRHLSKDIRGKLNLTKQEKADLVTFMVEGLSSGDQPKP